jgi:hypothetical protein
MLRTYHKDKPIVGTIALILTLWVSSLSNVSAQNSEIGFELAGHNYLGDVNKKFAISTTNLGGQFFIRRHINDAVSWRLSFGVGSIEGTDDQAFDVFSANRIASFDANFVNSDFLFEYHFLDYRNDRLEQFWTPYVFFGAGLYNLYGEAQIDGLGTSTSYVNGLKLRLPVGVGIKYRFNKRWILALSTSAIKTNSDLIDYVSEADPSMKNFSGGNPNVDDWMFYTALSISFTFHKIHCPEGWFK